MARKAWGDLSANYRRRLERAGITRSKHARGESLTRARGHKDVTDKLYRLENKWLKVNEGWTGADRETFREVRREYGDEAIYKMLQYQQKMQDLYHEGRYDKASALYRAMPPEFEQLPDWMKKYHGLFSF